MRLQRLGDPCGRDEPAAAAQVQVPEGEEPAARQQEAARVGRLPQGCVLPLGPVDSERIEQLPLREGRQRLADGALQADPERDNTGGAVAERPLVAKRQAEHEAEPILLRVHELLVAGRVLVPVVAVEARAHRQQVAERDRRRRLSEDVLEGRLDAGDDPPLDREAEQHPGDRLRARPRVAERRRIAVEVLLDDNLAGA